MLLMMTWKNICRNDISLSRPGRTVAEMMVSVTTWKNICRNDGLEVIVMIALSMNMRTRTVPDFAQRSKVKSHVENDNSILFLPICLYILIY